MGMFTGYWPGSSVSIPLSTVTQGSIKAGAPGLAAELLDPASSDLYNNQAIAISEPYNAESPRLFILSVTGKLCGTGFCQVEKLPVKAGKAVVKPRYFNYLHIHCRGVNLLARREAKDIWQNLYEYPLIETGQETELEVLQQTGLSGIDARGRRNTDTPKFHHAQTCTFTPHYLRPFL